MEIDPYDYECTGCERSQEDYKELGKVVNDLAMLVKRLASHLKKVEPNNKLQQQAMDYLKINNLTGSELRDK